MPANRKKKLNPVTKNWEYIRPARWRYEFEKKGHRVVSEYIYATKAEALRECSKAKEKYIDAKGKTFFSVREELSEKYNLRESTGAKSEFESVFKNHIKPFFPDRNLTKYTRNDLNSFIEILLAQGRSHHTINKTVSMINRTMRYAVRKGYLSVNPFDLPEKLPHTPKTKVFLTYEQYTKLLPFIKKQRYQIAMEILFWTGMRKGELLALQWKDIDFGQNTIHIHKHVRYQNHHIQVLNGRKKGIQSYYIEMPTRLHDELKTWLDTEKNVDGFSEDFYILSQFHPMSPENLRRALNVGLRDAGLPHVDIHSFRTSHVSYCFNYCPELTIQDIAFRIGDTVEVCMKHYSFIFKNRRGKYSTAIDQALEILEKEMCKNKKE